MNIAGIVKSSFIDYPGCASTVIFLGGCNFNCGYCHNPEIVGSGGKGGIEAADFLDFIEKRRRFVDAVCISGGEPTLYGEELYALIAQIKGLGYKVKLDTNGTNPQLLKRLLGCVDYLAMDIKGPWEKYGEAAGLRGTNKQTEALVAAVRKSLELLLHTGRRSDQNGGDKAENGSRATQNSNNGTEIGGFSYELRTTVCRELLTAEDVAVMARQLAGAERWYLQTFKKQGCLLDSEGKYSAYTPAEMEELRRAAEAVGSVGVVRVR